MCVFWWTQLTDSKSWSSATVQTIQEACSTNLAVNSSLWLDSNPNTEASTPTLPDSILNTLCPDQCGSHGQCVDGKDSWIMWCKDFLVWCILCWHVDWRVWERVCLREREDENGCGLFDELHPSPHCDIPGQQHYNPVTLTSVLSQVCLWWRGICDCYPSAGGIDCLLFINLWDCPGSWQQHCVN